MVFEDEAHTKCVRVLSLRTVKDVALLTSQPSTTVSNVHHMLIRPKGALKKTTKKAEKQKSMQCVHHNEPVLLHFD